MRGWSVGVGECPASIKDGLPKFVGNIDCSEFRGAKCRHKQDELKVGHAGILNIKGWHKQSLSGDHVLQSTGVSPEMAVYAER